MTNDQTVDTGVAQRAGPGPGRQTNSIGHPIERMLSVSAHDILDALDNGSRARAELKGKLAELFAGRYLDGLQMRGVIDLYEWQDSVDEPTFVVWPRGGPAMTVKVQSVRPGIGPLRIETQRLGATIKDPMSRHYRVDEFDVVAACLYELTGEWTYIFARANELRRSAVDDRYLDTIQVIRQPVGAPWTTDLTTLF